MKHGKTINELAAEIVRQQKSKRDFVLPTTMVEAFPMNGELNLDWATSKAGDERLNMPLTDISHRQLGEFCSIPAKYYDLMRKAHPGLLAQNVKHWLNVSSDRRMIRTLDGNIRAVLSDKYRRLDNFDIAQNILPMLNEANAEVESCEITEKRLYIKAITHKVQAEVKVGDVVSAGVLIQNSEVGHGSLAVKPLIYRLVCRNGAIADKYALKKYHVGRLVELQDVEFAQDTHAADDKSFWLQTRDLVKHCLNEVTFKKIVESMSETTTQKIGRVSDVIELVSSDYGFTDTERENVLDHLITGGDLTSWGLGNAVTRAAQDVESYDRSTELETFGFEIMHRNWKIEEN